jgi:uncharacterized protein YaiE (UPF0345 family)
MALVVADRVKETTTTTGTGAITLAGAEVNFAAFSSVLSDGDTTYYAIVDDSNQDFEVGLGTYATSGNTLTRTTVLASSNGGSAVDLLAGSKEVFINYPAGKSVYLDSSGQLVIGGTAVTSTAAELNILDGVTASTAEINILDGVTASTAEINILDGVTATTAELNILDGVTASTAEINILDGVTASTTEINYLDITTLGTSQASKAVTADVNGVVTFDNGTIEESTTLSGTSVTINLRDGDNFVHTLSGNTTYTFSNPGASGKASSFTLKVTQDSSPRTITWPSSVDWPGGTAPTISTGSANVDVFAFITYDGGTTYYGFTAGQEMS